MPRALIALILAFAVLAVPAAAAPRKAPKGAAFYKPPKHLKGKHGALIWARKQTGRDALKGARNELLLYRSKDVNGKSIAVSGSLAIPKGKAPKGGWPVISYAHGTTGDADACAPTRGFDANDLTSYAYPLLHRWLKAGYAIVRTDYQGLGTPGIHQYLIGKSEGRSVLDAVRAAREFDGRLSKRFVISGHSQGGHAALFAAAEAPTYVSDLKLRGTVAFAPASHLDTQFKTATQTPIKSGGLAGIILLGLRGLDAAEPSLAIPSLLTAQATAFYPQTKTECLNELAQPDSIGGVPLNQILSSNADVTNALAEAAKSNPETLRPRTPVRIEQGTADTTVFPTFTDQLVTEYKQNGVKVTYKTYDGVTHGGVVNAGAKDATSYLKRRLK